MQAIKQTMKAPENRELRIYLPDEVATDDTIEVILIYGESPCSHRDKINALKSAMNDEQFKRDLDEIASDFADTCCVVHPASGMWRDRTDMADPAAYVRHLRTGRFDAV